MKILFVHQNFPAQYLHLARFLVLQGHEIVCFTQRSDFVLPGVRTLTYTPMRKTTPGLHHYLEDVEMGVLNAQAVLRCAIELSNSGFTPDIMLGHNGWGEIWYLKEVFPNAPLLGYFEFFYRLHGADIGFDPSRTVTPDTAPRIRTKNLGNLLGLEVADAGMCPTQWQKDQYPSRYQADLHVIHEGVDTSFVVPDTHARLSLPARGIELRAGDEVVTYVSRNLEPYRGFPEFMRSLAAILSARPNAHAVILGGDEPSYGLQLPPGQTYRAQLLAELGDRLDLKRVHFLGKVPYSTFLTVLQVSRVHVYLTYPFVLSWSMLEAMSAQCLIVGSKTAPVEEVIRDGENGLLVDFFSHDAISEKVIAVLEDADRFAEFRENARRTIVEKYDLRTICLPAQLRLLDQIVADSRTRRP
jgi:glycosyltransferase involved in cell wall biosynthesis